MVQGHDGEFSCDRILIRRYRYPAHWTGTRPDPVISRSYEFAEVAHHVQPLGGLVARPQQCQALAVAMVIQSLIFCPQKSPLLILPSYASNVETSVSHSCLPRLCPRGYGEACAPS